MRLCKNSKWRPYQYVKICIYKIVTLKIHTCIYLLLYRLVSLTGKTKEMSAHSCNEIKKVLSKEYLRNRLQTGVYWVQNQQVTMYTAIAAMM